MRSAPLSPFLLAAPGAAVVPPAADKPLPPAPPRPVPAQPANQN